MADRSRPHRWIACALLAAIALVGCTEKKLAKPDPVGPPPTFSGPAYLHGTIGSLCALRGYEPLRVAGYSLVVNLNGTGSSETPAFLRQWLINEMRRRGVTAGKLGATPEQVLADPDTAVVAVEGLIPPGATKGTRFDVLVSALPQTQTTSLEGGDLWRTDLAVDGDNPSMMFSKPLAYANGSMYTDPRSTSTQPDKQKELQRQAVIVGGGAVLSDRRIELILTTPSWQRSRGIADRINERFPKGPDEKDDTAQPMNDTIIRVQVPKRLAGRSDELLQLVSHLFLQRSPNFEPEQAQRMADLLLADISTAKDVILCWRALGKTTLPVLRRYYDHPSIDVRLAALEAGAHLDDQATVEPLITIADAADVPHRVRAAAMLAHLPRNLRAAQALQRLLDDDDTSVRLAAYEALAAINDPTIQRMALGEKDRFKFMLDMVPSKKPLIYITQETYPRVVIFNPDLGFPTPAVGALFENHLMLRSTEADKPVNVFYQARGAVEGKTYSIAPTVANLVFLMGHAPSAENPTDGLDLPYGRVVAALNQLVQDGVIESPIQIKTSPLAQLIEQTRAGRALGEPRPETSGPGPFISIDPKEGDAATKPDANVPLPGTSALPMVRPDTEHAVNPAP